MLWASGEGDTRDSVPVDASVARVTFSASFDLKGGTLTVISPDGTPMQQGDRLKDTVLNCGRLVTVEAPATGIWHVHVVPTGRFWLTAQSRSDLSLITAEFVQPGGRPGHEDLFRSQGQPIAGRPATLRVTLSSAIEGARSNHASTELAVVRR